MTINTGDVKKSLHNDMKIEAVARQHNITSYYDTTYIM